jgi:HSP20 family molecular chaperone IbpA
MGAEYLKNINFRIMTTLLRELDNGLAPRLTTPFDILVRNFFDTETPFHPLHSVKLKHPVDVYEDSKGLHLEVACTGLTKEDITLDIEGDVLKVSYEKDNDPNPSREYHYSGIAKRSFNFGYKVNNRFTLSEAEAEMKDGLLNITVPYSPHSITKIKSIEIK